MESLAPALEAIAAEKETKSAIPVLEVVAPEEVVELLTSILKAVTLKAGVLD